MGAELEIGNLIFLFIAFTLSLLAFQRTVRNRKWMLLVFLILPVLILSRRWAGYREQLIEWRIAGGLALAANALFWLVWGGRHPPGFKGEIVVFGLEDGDSADKRTPWG